MSEYVNFYKDDICRLDVEIEDGYAFIHYDVGNINSKKLRHLREKWRELRPELHKRYGTLYAYTSYSATPRIFKGWKSMNHFIKSEETGEKFEVMICPQ